MTNVEFHGEDVRKVLEDNADVYKAVWNFCSSVAHGYVKVYVVPRSGEQAGVEWSMTVASPGGRRSYQVLQRRPNTSVSFNPG